MKTNKTRKTKELSNNNIVIYHSVSIQRLKSGIIQGWQSLLVYFERQTMYHEYIKMQTCKYVINVQK
jgi:hypothetical protein